MAGGAQPGNTHSSDGKVWKRALQRALAHRGDGDFEEGLRKLAVRMCDKAEEGDMAALKEIGDRFDGKPAQAITGPDGGPVEAVFKWAKE